MQEKTCKELTARRIRPSRTPPLGARRIAHPTRTKSLESPHAARAAEAWEGDAAATSTASLEAALLLPLLLVTLPPLDAAAAASARGEAAPKPTKWEANVGEAKLAVRTAGDAGGTSTTSIADGGASTPAVSGQPLPLPSLARGVQVCFHAGEEAAPPAKLSSAARCIGEVDPKPAPCCHSAVGATACAAPAAAALVKVGDGEPEPSQENVAKPATLGVAKPCGCCDGEGAAQLGLASTAPLLGEGMPQDTGDIMPSGERGTIAPEASKLNWLGWRP